MFKLIPVLIRLWPVIRPILPVLLALLRENEELLREKLARPETAPAEDARDFFREADDDEFWQRMTDNG